MLKKIFQESKEAVKNAKIPPKHPSVIELQRTPKHILHKRSIKQDHQTYQAFFARLSNEWLVLTLFIKHEIRTLFCKNKKTKTEKGTLFISLLDNLILTFYQLN